MDKTTSDILLYTQDMMLAVIDSQWDELMQMHSTQDKMLKNLFTDAEIEFSDQQKNDLFEVQRLNQEIISAAEKHKAGIAKDLRGMHQGKIKIDVYRSL